MARVNKALRERMQNRKKEMGRRGIVLDNKEWRKGRIRILPMREDQLEPGVEYLSFYCNEIKRSTTAPSCLGAPDPLWEALENIYKTGTEDEKEHAKDYIKRSAEYWLAVLVRGDEGTDLNPNIRVMRGKKTVYQEIADWLSNEDVGDDLTDADEGRDIFIRKEGEGINTEWKAQILDPSYLSDDEGIYEAVVAAAEKFDVRDHFFKFDLEVYEQMYEGLTGEELPEEYREELEALAESRGGKRSGGDEEEVEEDEESDDDEGAGYHDDEDEESDEEGDEEDAPDGIVFGETVVVFEGEDGEELEGVVQGWSEEEEGLCEVLVEGDDDPWDVDPDEWEVVEATDDAEESDEEEEADDEESDDDPEASDPPEGVTFGETRVSFEGDGDSEGIVMAYDEDGEHVLVLEDGYESLDDAWSVHPDDYEILDADDEEADEEEEEPEEAKPRVRGGKKKTTKKATTARKPKGGTASKGIRGGGSKATSKKTTTRKPSTSKKKTSKKTTTRKPSTSKKKTTKKTTTRKPSTSKKKTTKKKTTRKPAAAGRRQRKK